VKSLEGIRDRRENLLIDMKKDTEEKNGIIQTIEKYTQELEELNASLIQKEAIKREYDKVITNTEKAYYKLLEGSQTLLAILKRDEASLKKKLNDN
jgi:Sjoegren syndrome nuclear autoantigen 1